MSFTADTKQALQAKLDPAHVKTRKQASFSLDYIEGWHAIAEANRIFGFDGWSSETVRLEAARDLDLIDGKWRVGYLCKVRVAAGGVTREGTGYGSGIAKDAGDAIESAIKEAETDARKRALMTFGNPFGLALYDKTRANVGSSPEPQQERRTANSLRKDDSWHHAMRSLQIAIDLGEDALKAADRELKNVVAGWPPSWQEQYEEALGRAHDRVRTAA